MNGRGLLVALLLATVALPSGLAAAEVLQEVDVRIDEARLVRLPEDAAHVIVGNPAIADVAVQSARLLVVTGKSYGATNLIVLDREGRDILNARLGVAPNDSRLVTVYRGATRQSLHCTPECQRVLAIGDDKAQFEQLAETVTRKFGVANAAAGND